MNPIDYIRSMLKNRHIFSLLVVFTAVYGPRLHPRLPNSVRQLFHNPWFRSLILFLIVFVARRDIMVSIFITVAFVTVMYLVQMSQIFEMFEQEQEEAEAENFAVYGRPLADCSNYQSEDKEKESQPSYPMN
jgi:hypothetical protein